MEQKFLKNFTLGCAFLLILAGVSIVVADPFFHYHEPIGNLKAVVTKAEYQCIGTVTVRNFDYDSIVLGSSVAENYNNRWFDEAFGGKTIKGIKESGSTVDLVYYLNEALKAKKDSGLLQVYYSLDLFALTSDADKVFPDDSLPLYLYNGNIFDDVNYIWNKDVLFENIPYMLAMTYLDDYDEGNSYNWAQYKTFDREDTLSRYSRPTQKEDELSPSDYKENVDKNIDMLEEVVNEHPETTFRFMFPPYSMLWWDTVYLNGEIGQNLYATAAVAERLLSYDNVEMYYFQNNEELITDLDNYMDTIHFSDDINQAMVNWMKEGKYRLTLDNYKDEIEIMRTLIDKIEDEYLGVQ